MRTAMLSIFFLLAFSPAHASKSCMTMAEARAQFATSHLYWHGPNHCWDATAPAHRIYVTAFPTWKAFKQHMHEIAWDTEVWLAEVPDHMIHYNGPKFLAPRPDE